VHEEVEYAKPKDIIAKVVKFEDRINTGLKRLMGKIK